MANTAVSKISPAGKKGNTQRIIIPAYLVTDSQYPFKLNDEVTIWIPIGYDDRIVIQRKKKEATGIHELSGDIG